MKENRKQRHRIAPRAALFGSVLLLLLARAAGARADLYPGVGSDVSFTNQNETFYTLYARLGYAPSYRTYMDVGYSHEWDFTQTTQEFHIVYADLYRQVSNRWTVGGLANTTFGATPDTGGYYSLFVRPEARYAATGRVSVGAGPVYYYVSGYDSFLGVFLGVYVYPTPDWWLYVRGTVDTSLDPSVSEQDAALDMGLSYNIIKYLSVYGLFRLSNGVTTSPVNNPSSHGSLNGGGSMSTMAMGGSGMGRGGMNNNYPSMNSFSSTVTTFTIGLSAVF